MEMTSSFIDEENQAEFYSLQVFSSNSYLRMSTELFHRHLLAAK